ncbi:MAG: GspE/PulE family protein [bacterium]|nr:GspE/PulE family protein [bacterium]
MANAKNTKAPSIEDLLKKKTAVQTTPPSTKQGYVAGATKKTVADDEKEKKGKARFQMSEKEKLEEKMGDIELQELEKRTQERSAKLSIPYIDLAGFPISPETLALIPEKDARDTKTIAFLHQNDELRIATTNPGSKSEKIAKQLAKKEDVNVQTYIISDHSFKLAVKLYASLPETKEVIYGVRIDEKELERFEKEIGSFKDIQDTINKISTTEIVTLLIGAGIKSDVSDIHVEAEEKDVKIRFRIDGVLQDVASLNRDVWDQMISRLKLIAGAKINVEGVPQDGRITIYLREEKLDIRVSFLPTAYGESVVMRLLRPKSISLDFENLGVRGDAWENLKREIQRPNGMIVTTGPTGSGKTTTLYAILKKLNTPEVKIITLEDPIEYKLDGINQSQIDHEKKYDFARGLRSVLRQDPDIVMVGEIRDLETAEISIQAALTGHLVVSTLHTNSAPAAIPRFLSMGVKPFLLAPSINAVIGQRLVRRLCTTCKIKTELSASMLKEVKNVLADLPEKTQKSIDMENLVFYGPPEKNTCALCKGLGYKGRVGLYEIMTMTKEIEEVVLSGNVSEYQMTDIAKKQGMITMAQDGLLKALEGMTSVTEVLRVAEIQLETAEVPEAPEEETPTEKAPAEDAPIESEGE